MGGIGVPPAAAVAAFCRARLKILGPFSALAAPWERHRLVQLWLMLDVAFISFIVVFISSTALRALPMRSLHCPSECALAVWVTDDTMTRGDQACFAPYTLKFLTTPWCSSAVIVALFDVFEISINNSWFSLTAGAKFDGHNY